MILSLAGANGRIETDRKHAVLGAWLGGLLGGMVDPKTYPDLSSLLGEDDEAESEGVGAEDLDPEAAHAGAKLWIMFLNKK